jgi:hypothetical protein
VAGPALVSAKCLAGCYHALDITGPLVAYNLPTIKAIPQAMQRQGIGSAGNVDVGSGLAPAWPSRPALRERRPYISIATLPPCSERQKQRAVLRCIERAGRQHRAFGGLLTNHLRAGTAPQKLEIGIDNNV